MVPPTIAGLVLATFNASAAAHYVSVGSTNPTPPYTNWATAALTIQDAVDIASAGDEVVVTNGVYQTGARSVYGLSNRVAVAKALTVRSLNGPAVTQIVGYQTPGTTNGNKSVRCVYLTSGAMLVGFTLTNGATLYTGIYNTNLSGGGVWCERLSAVVSNCVLTGNSARFYGGGAYGGTLKNCVLTGNFSASYGGGASHCTLNNCVLTNNLCYSEGGGAYSGTLNSCVLNDNSASSYGGGASSATLNNCVLTGNFCGQYGGGASAGTLNDCTLSNNLANYGGGSFSSMLNNCTVSGNFAASHGGGAFNATLYNSILTGNSCADYGGGASGSTLINCTLTGNSANYGGGTYVGTLTNCIVYYNTATNSPNYFAGAFSYCCTTPLPPGAGNLADGPSFVNTNGWSNLHLEANSPCINAGNNAAASGIADLDGRPRVVDATVDIGAYEFQRGTSGAFIGWLQQYGLPTDGSADYSDADSDSMNNWQEWICGTCPTNSLSVLRLLSVMPTGAGATVIWQSVGGVNYFLERSANPGSLFTCLATNILGQADSTSYVDTNAGGVAPFFYRVGVGYP